MTDTDAARPVRVDPPAAAFAPRERTFRENPYPTYHVLRARSPVFHRAEPDDWVIMRHADVMTLAKEPRLGGVELGGPESAGDGRGRVDGTIPSVARFHSRRQETLALRDLWLVNRTPPDHTRLRRALQRVFALGHAEALRARIEALTAMHLDLVTTRGEMDIIRDLSAPLSFTIVADLLGLPDAARPALQRAVPELVVSLDLDPTLAAFERGVLAMVGLTQYFRGLLSARLGQPVAPENHIDALAQAQAEGQVSEAEILAHCTFMLVAGHVTSQHLIGNGVLALLRHPDQLDLLRRHPALIGSAIDELLRYDTPIQVLQRRARADVEIAGQTIRKGQRVHLVLGSANRDPAVFSDPDRLDVMRDRKPHVSFGHGLHYCLGAALAKLTAEVAIGALLHRMPRLRLQRDALDWEDTYMLHGLTSLPVSFT